MPLPFTIALCAYLQQSMCQEMLWSCLAILTLKLGNKEQAPYCHSLPKGTKVALARVQFVDDGHVEVVVWMEHKLDGDCAHDCDKFNHIAERVIFPRRFL